MHGSLENCNSSVFPVVWNYSCRERRLECLLLRSNQTETHMCKQATGETILLLTSETFCVWIGSLELDSRLVRIGDATGSQVSSNVRCVEPWRELVGLVWFLRCCYCMEKSQDKLMRFVYNHYKRIQIRQFCQERILVSCFTFVSLILTVWILVYKF